MNPDILSLLLRVAADSNSSNPNPIDLARGADAPLFGAGAPLDSMALVRFVVEIEAEVEDLTGVPVVLANERAMSQRRSPFLTLGTLAGYITELLNESKEAAA